MSRSKKLLTKGDIILSAIIVLVCAITIISRATSSDSRIACVYVDGELKKEINLDTLTDEITFQFGSVTLHAEKNGIRFLSSDCTDELCVKHGLLSKSGDCMACVPSGVVVSIKSSLRDNSPHAITY